MVDASRERREKVMIWLFLAVLIASGSFLRLWNLGRASLWVDETNAAFAAKSLVENGTMAFPSGYVYTRAPLYTFMTAWFFKWFGMDEASIRLTAALFGILCIWMAYMLAKKVFNARVGLLTAFFMAFSHFEVGWSRTAKMYTMLQFLFLAAITAFISGFEADADLPVRKGRSSALSRFMKKYQLSPIWLVLSGVIFAYAGFRVHYLILLVFVGILLYCASMAVLKCVRVGGRERFLNKYTLVSVAGIGATLLLWSLIPAVRQQVHYFVSYTPTWAEGGSSAQYRFFLFEFLISPQRFPFAAFFFIGSLLTLTRQNKLAWLGWCIFSSAVLVLSFVFTHRVPTYLFFVYPLFLATAAFGFVSFLELESDFLDRIRPPAKPWLKKGLVIAALSIFLISPWLRMTLHIPFLPDGVTNMAVSPEEWRQASKTVLDRKQPGDLVITSLPQIALFYGLKSDYGLNRVNLELTRYEGFFTKDGRRADIYAGVACIESLGELRRLVQTYPRGWLVVSQFHMENDNYIPADERGFILNRFPSMTKTEHGTILIFGWDKRTGG